MIAMRILLAAIVIAGLSAADAVAQPYPNRPIKLIVPFPAGGPPDTLARLVGNDISSRLGQTVVIDNRPGGGATIGTRVAANAEPRRLHAAVRQHDVALHRPGAVQEPRLRSGQELRAGGVGLARLDGGGRECGRAGENGDGARRLRQGQSRQAPQRLRRRLSAPHRLGIVHADDRDRHRVRPLSRHGAGHDRPGGRPDSDDDRRHRVAAAPHPRRQGARARRHRHDPQPAIFPTSRP